MKILLAAAPAAPGSWSKDSSQTFKSQEALELSAVMGIICRLEQGHLGDIQVPALFPLGFLGFLH